MWSPFEKVQKPVPASKLLFPMMQNNEELKDKIQAFDDEVYQMELEQLFAKTEMVEDGMASKNVISIIQKER